MIHLGDITKIKGSVAPVVDCIIGGSPCQDLSVAGKRAGLAGERSGLYMEQIRIIKEMREADVQRGKSTVDIRPRYMVWENVPGAFSSNGGNDFAAVLEEAIRVAEPEAPAVRVPEKGWPSSGCFWDELGRWSVAWRVLDAQFWGTPGKPLPQRRRRIALVADFGGLSASEILFVRQSVSGDIEPGKPKGKEAAGAVGEGSEGASEAVGFPLGFRPENVRCYEETATTLCNGTRPGFTTGVLQPVIAIDQHGGKGGANYSVGVSPPILSDSHGTPHAVAYVYDARGNGDGRLAPTMTGDHNGHVNDYTALCVSAYGIGNGQVNQSLTEEKVGALNCMHDQQAILQPILLESNQNHATVQTNGICTTLPASMGMGGGYVPMVTEPVTYQKVTGPLMANSHPGSYTGQDAFSDMLVAGIKRIVRRLTPLECERLQGYPDGWTDIGEWVDSKGKRHKPADSPRYKALGNSIAIPPWKWVLKRICACYERDATMASLFDGIGGFPYIWEQLNGRGSCLWASEIEEFPMAVTKLRFGGN